MGNTTIRVIEKSEELESLAGSWHDLLQRCGEDNSMYLTHEWISTWWKYFGEKYYREAKKLNILLIEKDGRIIGIVPLIRTKYRMGLIKLDTLESIGRTSSNYVGLLLPESYDEAISALLAYLDKEMNKSRTVLRLLCIPEDSRFLGCLRSKFSLFSKNMIFQEKVDTLAPYITLPATWEQYFRSLSSNFRRTLRKKLRVLERAHAVNFQECTAASLEEKLSKFFDLHQRRWQSINISSEFSRPKSRAFWRDLSNQFLKKNWLHLSYLIVDSEVVSVFYGCIYNQKFYDMIGARDPRLSRYSIGHLHNMFLIKEMIQRRLREFDFLRGSEPYKFNWTKSARRYFTIIIIKKGIWPSLQFRIVRVFERLSAIRKQSLRGLYSLYLMRRRERKR